MSLGAPLPVGEWVYVVNTYDAATGTMRYFTDGLERASQNAGGSINESAEPLLIGDGAPGGLDEVRISAGARSAGYVALQYLSMTDAALSFGPPQPAL